MIIINLLPKELVPKRRNFVPHLVIAGIAVVLFFWFGGSLAASFSELNARQNDLAGLKEDLAKLDDVVKQVKQLGLRRGTSREPTARAGQAGCLAEGDRSGADNGGPHRVVA